MTDRISVTKSSPATSFFLEADRASQSIEGNYTVVRCYLRAENGPGGTTGSTYGGTGYQSGSIDGVGEFGRKTANPFLPSGYADEATRWRIGPFDVQVPHSLDGTRGAVTLRMRIDYGSIDQQLTASFNDFPAIPRGPRVKVAGVWKNSVAYVKVAGIWKVAIPYVKVSGTWKVGGG